MSNVLTTTATVSVIPGVGSALVVALDLLTGHEQKMAIMDVVWPLTALWSGPIGLWAYFRYGRAGEARAAMQAQRRDQKPPNRQQPFPVLVGKGTTHCGSGCTAGDVVAELLVLAIPLTILGKEIFGAWVYDYVLAFLFGIAFQYFTIKPMKHLSRADGLKQAVKADVLSLTAWQVGMYGWMAIMTFAIFGREIPKSSPVFWFMMQIAMLFGFFTSYPVNWWLLRRGVKEKM